MIVRCPRTEKNSFVDSNQSQTRSYRFLIIPILTKTIILMVAYIVNSCRDIWAIPRSMKRNRVWLSIRNSYANQYIIAIIILWIIGLMRRTKVIDLCFVIVELGVKTYDKFSFYWDFVVLNHRFNTLEVASNILFKMFWYFSSYA